MKRGESDTMLAFLAQSHTQDHQDRGDWVHGLAGLVNFGDYRGMQNTYPQPGHFTDILADGDLVLRDLGLQIDNGSGDCILFVDVSSIIA